MDYFENPSYKHGKFVWEVLASGSFKAEVWFMVRVPSSSTAVTTEGGNRWEGEGAWIERPVARLLGNCDLQNKDGEKCKWKNRCEVIYGMKQNVWSLR